jgi:hypothetical protein
LIVNPAAAAKAPGSDNVLAMPFGRRHLVETLLLVTVAIAGLLSMHGFDGAVASFAAPAHVAHSPTGDAEGHDTLGICLFVTAIVGIGFASLSLLCRAAGPTRSASVVGPIRFEAKTSISGRSRLVQICVLRL